MEGSFKDYLGRIMAKIVKKKPAAKVAAKSAPKAGNKTATKPAKKAPVKAAAKPAPKKPAAKVVIKKKAEKPVAKVAKKVELKKKTEVKAPVKATSKPSATKAPPDKLKAKVQTKEAVKESAKEPKLNPKEDSTKKADKKSALGSTASEAAEKSAKKESKAAAVKKGAKPPKKEEGTDLDDDFIADDDLMGDEIGEYEEELKAVEEADEDIEVVDEWVSEERSKADEEVVLTDAEGRRYCRARDCDQIAIVDTYCRYHYLLFWKRIQVRKKILIDGKLERYVEELTARYPDKFLEMIRRDLRTEKDFLGAIQELEIDESAGENELEEDTSAYIEEVRGMESSGSGVEDDEY